MIGTNENTRSTKCDNLRKCPVKAKFDYLDIIGCSHLKGAAIVKLWTSEEERYYSWKHSSISFTRTSSSNVGMHSLTSDMPRFL